jgi:subtilisin family serine protease
MRTIVVLLLCLLSPAAHAERILIQPRPGLAQADLDSKLAAVRGKRVDYIHQINIHVVELPERADPRAASALLRADSRDINFAEVDERVAPTFLPNDPGLASEWYATKIGAQTAWNSAKGVGVIVAILDSGADPTHPDLATNLVPGYNFYNNNPDTRDVYGHGTKVAGTVAMVGNNLKGGAGVAFGARIMPIRVTDTSGYGSYSAMAKGITWAADKGARVANMSFHDVCGSSTIHSAANYMRSKGGVVTASAGNRGVLESLTASGSITCVSATGSTDARTSWSSYGGYVDVAAPGAGIYTTVRGGSYGSVSGTSFSAPITAAVYALMMSLNRSLTPSQLDSILFSTAKDLGTAGKDQYYGYGRVDAAAAVAKAYASAPAPSDTTLPKVGITSPQTGTTVAGTVAVNVSATDNVGVSRVYFYAGGTFIASDSMAPYAFSWNTASRANGSVVLEARAIDAKGNVGSHKVTVTVANATVKSCNGNGKNACKESVAYGGGEH